MKTRNFFLFFTAVIGVIFGALLVNPAVVLAAPQNFSGTRGPGFSGGNGPFTVTGGSVRFRFCATGIQPGGSAVFGINHIVLTSDGCGNLDLLYGDGSYTFLITNGNTSGNISWTLQVDSPIPGPVVKQEGEAETYEASFTPGDARLNQRVKDRGASAAVYCVGENIQIWRIDENGEGWLTLTITPAEVEAVGIPSVDEHHFTLAEAPVPLGMMSVYRLHTGEFQVNAAPVRADGDSYTFVWTECEIQK